MYIAKKPSPNEIQRHTGSKSNSDLLDKCIGFSGGYLFFLLADYKQNCTNDPDNSLILTLSIPMTIITIVFLTLFLFAKYKDYAKKFNSKPVIVSYGILILIYLIILLILLLTNSTTFATISIVLGCITTIATLVFYNKIELLFDENKLATMMLSPIIGFTISFMLHFDNEKKWNKEVTTKNLLCRENRIRTISLNQIISDCEQVTLNCMPIKANSVGAEKCTINSLTCSWKK